MCILCWPVWNRRQFGLTAGLSAASVFGYFAAPARGWAAQACSAIAPLPGAVAGVRIPDTDLARGAADLAQTESDPFLFNHCMRTFVLASIHARRSGSRYDEELVFVSSALHDLGLLKKFESSTKIFEEAGADYAQRYVLRLGFSPDRADRVWKGIAWHAGKAPADAPSDIKLIEVGAAIDVFGGADFDLMRPEEVCAILAKYPRLAFKTAFKTLLADHANRYPAQAGWTAQFAKEPPSAFVKAVLNSPWPE